MLTRLSPSQTYYTRSVALPIVSPRISQGGPGLGEEVLPFLTFISHIRAKENLNRGI